MTRLWQFSGGLRLPGNKKVSKERIITASLPDYLILPLLQHIGDFAHPAVSVGDHVLKGQVVAYCASVKNENAVSSPVHASSSGTVIAIEEREVPHPSGLRMPCVVIECDGKDQWVERKPLDDCSAVDPQVLRDYIANAGVVGLGGAGFPSHMKLKTGSIDTLILNGAECEPYISCDDFLMRERAEQVLIGGRVLARALGNVKRIVVAVEDNKPEAIAALEAAKTDSEVEIVRIPTRYPTGGERQLIHVLTGKEIPYGTLPAKYGIVMHNVGTAAAVYQAVREGKPLISRIMTMTGDGVESSRNLEVLFGTPMYHLLEQCGYKANVKRLVMGGPMMGFALPHDQLPIVKTTNCLIASTEQSLQAPPSTMPCIRCGACEQACPIQLLPQQMYWHARAKDFNRIQQFNLFDCIECGCCSYVCPSKIPLVQYYRYAKSEIRMANQNKVLADKARTRHEFRAFRLEREKAERQARHKQKSAVVKKPDDAAKKAAIQAALARAEAKKAERSKAEAGTHPASATSSATESSE